MTQSSAKTRRLLRMNPTVPIKTIEVSFKLRKGEFVFAAWSLSFRLKLIIFLKAVKAYINMLIYIYI